MTRWLVSRPTLLHPHHLLRPPPARTPNIVPPAGAPPRPPACMGGPLDHLPKTNGSSPARKGKGVVRFKHPYPFRTSLPQHCPPKLRTNLRTKRQNQKNVTSPFSLDCGVNVILHTENVELAENWERNYPSFADSQVSNSATLFHVPCVPTTST